MALLVTAIHAFCHKEHVDAQDKSPRMTQRFDTTGKKLYACEEIATDGRAYNMRIVQGLGLGLEDAAVDAISQWRFQPATRDGIPVPAQATVEINWRLM